LFVIAGRNATVGYSDLFEKYLFASVKNTLEENLNQPFDRKKQNIDEALMLYFIERVSRLKSFYQKSGGLPILVPMWIGDSKPEEIFKNNDANNKTKQVAENFLQKREERQQFLTRVITLINKILKGEYHFDNDGEKIILNNREKIHLHNASSGQQEVIRILQDIFMIFLEASKVLRIIEEPEAHLFPVAQKQLIELLALMVNYQPENQLIITTHSPYILTVFNHLLFASRVVAKNPAAEEEVKEIVDKDYWLDPNEFSAYSLGNESFPEDNAKYCESIFDTEMGMLQQNYLDTVSEILGWEFNTLYRIYTKSHRRK
jgi:predicted ATPase